MDGLIDVNEYIGVYTNEEIELNKKLYEECQVKNIIKDLNLLEECYENRAKFGHFKN